jgi:competence protein ComEC
MTSGKSPLVFPALCWIIGLTAGKYVAIPIIPLAAFILTLFILLFLRKNKIFLLFVLIILLGILRISVLQLKPQNHISRFFKFRTQSTQPLSGLIDSEVSIRNGRSSFDLKLDSIADYHIQGKIRFSSFDSNLKYGDKINTIAVLSALKSSNNPLATDFKEYFQFKGIHGSGFSKIPVTITGNKINWLNYLVIELRKFIRFRIEQRCPENAGFLKAILIGDKSELNEIRDILTRAGLSHILAVSGLHVALITVIFFTIIKIFIRHRIFLRLVTITLLLFYGYLCSWSPSVSRAVIMITLYFTAQILQRKVSSNNILFASLLVITAVNPYQLFSVGMHLSFCAVFVLLNILPFFTRYIYKIPIRNRKLKILVSSILALMTVSLVLSLFLSPITLYNFNQFNLNGVIGNLLGIPLISIILPLSIILLLIPSIPFLVNIYHSSLDSTLAVFNYWSESASELPLHFNFIPISLHQVLLLYLLLLTGFWLLLSYKKSKIISFFLLLLLVFLSWQNYGSNKLQVIFFNCGLGDLSLIETPDNEVIMIDCGPTEKDPGTFKRSALPYFQKKGIKKLDWLIVTHAHNDHYGGINDVFHNLEVKNLMVTDEFQTRGIWPEIFQQAQDENAVIHTIEDTTYLKLGEVKIKILHPDKDYFSANKNNMSIVLKLEYGELSILFNGDLEEEGEHYLITRYSSFLDSDVTKVGHHGSKTSSSAEYVELISPEYAIISTSMKNRFNFPHQQTLDTYSYLRDNLIITGRDGAFIVVSDGVNTEYGSFSKETK